MNMKRTFLGEVMPKRTESVLCAIIALAVTGIFTADNWPGDMRLESDWDSAATTRTNSSIATGVFQVQSTFNPTEDTACIKNLVELNRTRMTRTHARLALAAMEYAILTDREGEFVGILAEFLAKGLKKEGAK